MCSTQAPWHCAQRRERKVRIEKHFLPHLVSQRENLWAVLRGRG